MVNISLVLDRNIGTIDHKTIMADAHYETLEKRFTARPATEPGDFIKGHWPKSTDFCLTRGADSNRLETKSGGIFQDVISTFLLRNEIKSTEYRRSISGRG